MFQSNKCYKIQDCTRISWHPWRHSIINGKQCMQKRWCFFLLALEKLGYIHKGCLKMEFEFIHQQGCENNCHKLRNES